MLSRVGSCYRVWRGQASNKRLKLSSGRQLHYCAYCSASIPAKKKLVFLGTPQVAANVLARLFEAGRHQDASFEIAAVVSQPGRPKGRGNRTKPQPSPVETLAREQGLASERILCPVKASEAEFLKELQSLQPDLCLTAAYGNILPKAFLQIPVFGTLNIHPSLLPQYRGAAPVQRAVQDGVRETGVSVAFTVRAMDAGPVLAQRALAVDPAVQAPELLETLFQQGTELLLESLPGVWSGKAAENAKPQDEGKMTHAAKLTKEEGILDFQQDALTLHNKIRAFAGWPGTTALLEVSGPGIENRDESVKIVRAKVAGEGDQDSESRPFISVKKQGLMIHCGQQASDGGLEVLEVQPVGKKAMPVASFVNGLSNKTIKLKLDS